MEQRNLLLAIVLSVGILIGFQFLFEKVMPPKPPPPAPVATQPAPATANTQAGAVAPAPATTPGAAETPKVETREAALSEQPRIKISTPRLHGSINLVGGRIDDLTLATYHDTVDPKSPEVVLLWPA